MKICGIYKITNIIDNKVYIGLSRNISIRWTKHRSELNIKTHKNPYLQNAYNKYGEQNFRYEVILECSVERLNEEEVRLIKEYKSNNRKFGYNIGEGGESQGLSEETKRKISVKIKGLKRSEVTKNKLREISSNRSKTTLAKMRKIQLGKKHTEATKNKMSASHRGKTMPIEARAKISEASVERELLRSVRLAINIARQRILSAS